MVISSRSRSLLYFFSITPRPPNSTLFPYTTLFRSQDEGIPADKEDYFLTRGYNRNDRIGKSGLEEQYEDILFFKRSEEHTSELQSRFDLVCRLLLEKKK